MTSFVHAMVKKIIPLATFGSEENRAVILRSKDLQPPFEIVHLRG